VRASPVEPNLRGDVANRRVSVMGGPVLGAKDRPYRDDAKVPLEFWKVLDKIGCERTAVFATGESGAAAILFAATFPERTSALILANATARFTQTDGYSFGFPPEAAMKILDDICDEWVTGTTLAKMEPSSEQRASVRRRRGSSGRRRLEEPADDRQFGGALGPGDGQGGGGQVLGGIEGRVAGEPVGVVFLGEAPQRLDLHGLAHAVDEPALHALAHASAGLVGQHRPHGGDVEAEAAQPPLTQMADGLDEDEVG